MARSSIRSDSQPGQDDDFWIMTALGATWCYRAEDRRFWHGTHRNVHSHWGSVMDDFGNMVHSTLYWEQKFSDRFSEMH